MPLVFCFSLFNFSPVLESEEVMQKEYFQDDLKGEKEPNHINMVKQGLLAYFINDGCTNWSKIFFKHVIN